MNIKKIIQEEMDGLDWVKDTSYEHYVGTEFWNAGSDVRIPFVISDVDKDGQVTIKHGNRVIGHKPIKDFLYGVENGVYKLVKESDDFGWMTDIDTLSYRYLRGKALEFDPYISNQETLDSVLKVLNDIGFKYGSWAYEFNWSEEYNEIVGLYLKPDGSIVWTSWINENYEEHISEYVGHPVEVLDGWSVLGGSINENFDWVKETLGRDELIQEIKDMVVNNPNYIPNGEYLLLKNSIPYSVEYPLSMLTGKMVKDYGYDLRVIEVWDTAVSISVIDNNGEWVDNDSQKYEDLPHEFLVKLHDELKKEDTSLSLFEENFDWVKEIDKYAGPLHGVKFIRPYYLNKDVHTIYDDNRSNYVIIYWRGSDGVTYDRAYDREKVQKYLEQGRWEKVKSDINEDFDWTSYIPAGPDLEKEMSWKEMVAFLKERFEGTRFFVSVNGYDDDEYPYISIEDGQDGGTYEDWYSDEVTTLGHVIGKIKETCETHDEEDIRSEYCELYDTIIGYNLR